MFGGGGLNVEAHIVEWLVGERAILFSALTT